MFELHPQLQKDCFQVCELELSRVLLLNDRQYPWVILVPRRENIREIYELSELDQLQLQRESSAVAKGLMSMFNGEKMNIAALGNMVPQLHLHHIVRFSNDPAWPSPVWGVCEAKPYPEEEAKALLLKLERQFLTAINDG